MANRCCRCGRSSISNRKVRPEHSLQENRRRVRVETDGLLRAVRRVPLPLGEGDAKRRVRVAVYANPETLTLPSPSGRGWIFRTRQCSRALTSAALCNYIPALSPLRSVQMPGIKDLSIVNSNTAKAAPVEFGTEATLCSPQL